ncbi:GAF domain-containing protein [Rhodococcoides corynebacterioides]|uniref:GAF domain-containing protein n=1 Tax=Rhodococcoides corynebacterioides TaxID=53972 RepID=UPI001C9BAFEB|nr:GAF domain-containing protein [Rhodococcus corynebacterioides]MBY6352020.1 DUF5593 domain-containing protein [Rhodococcus corynebacterioides]
MNTRYTELQTKWGVVVASDKVGGWVVLETAVPVEPSVVFDQDRTKDFGLVHRRKTLTHPAISSAITIATHAVRLSGEPHSEIIYGPTQSVRLSAHPVHGYDAVHGVQIWLGDPDAEPAPPRTIEGWSYDPNEKMTYHGKGVDPNILGVDEPRPLIVAAPAYFQQFDRFERELEVGQFVSAVGEGTVPEGHSFEGDVELTDGHGVERTIHVTGRGVNVGTSRPMVHGLLHDITDIRPPSGHFERRFARDMAKIIGATHGVGHYDFQTKMVTEWLTDPPAPLHRWKAAAPQYHPDECPRICDALQPLTDGRSEYVEMTVRLRFPDTDWIPATLGLRAAHAGPRGRGLLTVRSATPT